MFQPLVDALGVLAHDDQVQVWKAGGHPRQAAHRPDSRVQLQPVPQQNIHVGGGLWRATGGGEQSSLEGDPEILDTGGRLLQLPASAFVVRPHHIRPMPIDVHTGRRHDAKHLGGDLLVDGRANDEGYLVSHAGTLFTAQPGSRRCIARCRPNRPGLR